MASVIQKKNDGLNLRLERVMQLPTRIAGIGEHLTTGLERFSIEPIGCFAWN
jgi:hypothetical protein